MVTLTCHWPFCTEALADDTAVPSSATGPSTKRLPALSVQSTWVVSYLRSPHFGALARALALAAGESVVVGALATVVEVAPATVVAGGVVVGGAVVGGTVVALAAPAPVKDTGCGSPDRRRAARGPAWWWSRWSTP